MKESCSICRHYSQWDDIALARVVDIFLMLIQICSHWMCFRGKQSVIDLVVGIEVANSSDDLIQ